MTDDAAEVFRADSLIDAVLVGIVKCVRKIGRPAKLDDADRSDGRSILARIGIQERNVPARGNARQQYPIEVDAVFPALRPDRIERRRNVVQHVIETDRFGHIPVVHAGGRNAFFVAHLHERLGICVFAALYPSAAVDAQDQSRAA